MSLENRKIAFLFPGQGSQYEKMGQELIGKSPVYEKSKEIIEPEVYEIIKTGKLEKISETRYGQLAIFLNSIALLKEFLNISETYGIPFKTEKVALIGLSLGEYSALCGSGIISLEEGIKLVDKRGQIMSEGVAGKGGMIAIMRPEIDIIIDILDETGKELKSGEIIEICNYNSPKQIVVGGSFRALDIFENKAREKGLKKTVRLNVEGPFHTEVLKKPSEEFKNYLKDVTVLESQWVVYSNVDGKAYNTAIKTDFVEKLTKQMYSPVKFQMCIENAIENGYNTFIEIGAGKSLGGFVKKTNKDVEVFNIEKDSDIMEVIKKLQN